ncbi:TonB-dependent receptor [Sphingomonas colocasiae]|uniref:TonB-dependent receptor n=1 Tax=Sphingomonas colocasiae TaxID=1848973 RepID=A0ABS7PR44_9SPHN|nr:TonB-dependent receptor [Sphingomonas colocasiae]MBY8823459.1 TonB-dependent receptor [Sphingomonas colocasiae]
MSAPHWSILLAGTSLLAAAPALAQDPATSADDEVIVVTAQKRAQDLQDVPISVAVASAAQLREQNIISSVALGRIVPNLTVSDYGNPVFTIFTLRGVSQFDFSDHQESPVAVFTDGSYVPYLSAVGANLFDLERVEVLRGPQGTLFGRNATGGVVQLISARPTEQLSGYGQLSYGNYKALRAEGAISGPIGGGVLGRLSVVRDRHDGYFRNITTGTRKGDGDNVSARGQLYKEFAGGSDIGLIARYSRDTVSTIPNRAQPGYPDPVTGLYVNGSGPDFAAFCSAFFGTGVGAGATDCLSGDVAAGGRYTIQNDRDGGGLKRTSYGATLTANLKLSDDITLTSVTSYSHLDKAYRDEDSDGTSLDYLRFEQGAKARDVQQELRLTGKGDWGQWLLGAYYLNIHGRYDSGFSFYPTDPDFQALASNRWTLRTRSIAFFGQGEVRLAERLKLVGGLRYTWDRKTIDYRTACLGAGCGIFGLDNPDIVQGTGYNASVPGARPVRSTGNWDGKIQLSYEPSADALLYAGVSRGTKAGGFNAGTTAFYTVAQTRFDDEVLTDYEAGFKLSLVDRRLTINGSLFYYDYKGVQLFSQLGTSTLTFNSDARIYGAELEARARVTSTLDIGAAGALLDTRTDPVEVLNPLAGTVTLSRQALPNAPKRTLTLYGRKVWPIGEYRLTTQGDVKWLSATRLNLIDYPATRQPAYALANARISFGPADGPWEISAFVQNMFDKAYSVAAVPYQTTNGATMNIYAPPRLYGVSGRFVF